ncbi:Similar to Parp: Poly [ADP-ribose] polymerase (Drosophila melanogaster) [Cotesia congregata]|uniref:Poly [ADP-ribose] polymerase n=1 Tax=Cotesia congregata TaxID=51543 RepID=A0A8J2HAH3_COTCN|nr:Similar to Parp: Poly [ADP-ribose] polymerase (Drosophila melanogaster) [Cotesia congregata]
MSDLPYRVDYPSTTFKKREKMCHYSDCKKCILKDSLRISIVSKSLFFHPECFFKTVENPEVGDFDNFENLKWEDQKFLQEFIAKLDPDKNAESVTYRKKEFSLGYSTSNHGKCLSCEKRIEKNTVKISLSSESWKHEKIYHSYHWECFCHLPEFNLFENINEISGYNSLKPKDQQTLARPVNMKTGNLHSSEMADQSDKLFAVINSLQLLKRMDIIDLLKFNNQLIINTWNVTELKNILADRLIFGALDPCPECSGKLNFKSGLGYQCTSQFSEWCKCSAVFLDPPRSKFVVPDNIKKKHNFLKTFEPCVQRRLIKVSAPSDIVNVDGFDKKSKRPLRGMHFVIDDNLKDNKEHLVDDITKLGGLVVDEVHENVAAVISDKSNFKKNSQVIKMAKEYDIQVVSIDFIKEAKNFIDTPVSLIVDKNFSSWGGSPSKRIATTIAKSVKFEDLEDNMSSEIKKQLENFIVDECNNEKFSITLANTEIGSNLNNYFKIQVLKSPGINQPKAYLVQSWGRIGTNIGGSNLQELSLQECHDLFQQLYWAKTGNCWKNRNFNFVKKPGKMYPIETVTDKPVEVQFSIGSEKNPVTRLLMLIFNVEKMSKLLRECKIDTSKMPLGMLESKTMDKAFVILGELQTFIKNSDRLRIIERSNRFYAIIPQSFGLTSPPILDTLEKIRSMWDMTDSLKQIAIAYEMTKNSVIDDHLLNLGVHIAVLDANDKNYTVIQTYLKNTHGSTHNYRLKIEDVFKVKRSDEDSSFAKYSNYKNRRLLWHGSLSTNFAGILSQGLRIAPPEAPPNGYMFGKGVYFADIVTKSANYCRLSYNNPTGLLLLCEVALGEMYEKIDAEYITQLPKGKDSVWGLGSTYPDPGDVHVCQDGVIVPYGKPVSNDTSGFKLHYNEFVVYNVGQIRIRYIVRVRLDRYSVR